MLSSYRHVRRSAPLAEVKQLGHTTNTFTTSQRFTVEKYGMKDGMHWSRAITATMTVVRQFTWAAGNEPSAF